MKKELFTLGVEEEFQIIDPKTRRLISHMHHIVEEGKETLQQPGLFSFRQYR